MGRSLSLAAYLAYARRATKAPPAPNTPRPKGELVWVHAVDADRAVALLQFAERLELQRPGLHVLLTTSEGVTLDINPEGMAIWQILPEDTIVAAEAFLHHWTPDICLWTGGDLHPAMLISADQIGVPLFLIDTDEHLLIKPVWRWFPDLPKSLLGRFSVIMTRTTDAARYLRRIGVDDTVISVTSPLQEGAVALPYSRQDREELSSVLRGRPVWLATMLQLTELDIVMKAHHAVSKLAHRSLLIIMPNNDAESSEFQKRLERDGWRVANRSAGETPEETTQILLADHSEMGLWYELATISFMGSSLIPGQTGCDPNEPAAHGSAILYGPNVRRYLSSYSRYAEAGAARIVRDADTLAAAVQTLIAPDQSAMMAHSAWEVATAGAEVADQLLDLVQDALDVVEETR